MIEVADELLDCNRRLIDAHAAMGPSNLSPWGPLVRIPLLP